MAFEREACRDVADAAHHHRGSAGYAGLITPRSKPGDRGAHIRVGDVEPGAVADRATLLRPRMLRFVRGVVAPKSDPPPLLL